MPPPETEQFLTDEERDLLVRWVEQGAGYEEHWAWKPLERPEAPERKAGPEAVDAFLEAGWERESVEPGVGEFVAGLLEVALGRAGGWQN